MRSIIYTSTLDAYYQNIHSQNSKYLMNFAIDGIIGILNYFDLHLQLRELWKLKFRLVEVYVSLLRVYVICILKPYTCLLRYFSHFYANN